jgi:hypothetical protein
VSPAAILSVPLASVWLLTAGIMKRRTGMKEPGAPILEAGYPTAPEVRLTLI